MASLPVPAKVFFSDFSFALMDYTVFRDNKPLGTVKGLADNDHSGNYVSFLLDIDLRIGDVLLTKHRRLVVQTLEYDTYQGEDQLVRAYYL